MYKNIKRLSKTVGVCLGLLFLVGGVKTTFSAHDGFTRVFSYSFDKWENQAFLIWLYPWQFMG
jgi:hypothetical protein